KAISGHRAHRLLSESALILCTFRNGPARRQSSATSPGSIPELTGFRSGQRCHPVKSRRLLNRKPEARKCPFCHTLIETTEFRRGIDEATNPTNEMVQNLQRSLRSIKINLKL